MSELGPELLRKWANAGDMPIDGLDLAAQWERERTDAWVVRRATQITGLTWEAARDLWTFLVNTVPGGGEDNAVLGLRKFAELAKEDE